MPPSNALWLSSGFKKGNFEFCYGLNSIKFEILQIYYLIWLSNSVEFEFRDQIRPWIRILNSTFLVEFQINLHRIRNSSELIFEHAPKTYPLTTPQAMSQWILHTKKTRKKAGQKKMRKKAGPQKQA